MMKFNMTLNGFNYWLPLPQGGGYAGQRYMFVKKFFTGKINKLKIFKNFHLNKYMIVYENEVVSSKYLFIYKNTIDISLSDRHYPSLPPTYNQNTVGGSRYRD